MTLGLFPLALPLKIERECWEGSLLNHLSCCLLCTLIKSRRLYRYLIQAPEAHFQPTSGAQESCGLGEVGKRCCRVWKCPLDLFKLFSRHQKVTVFWKRYWIPHKVVPLATPEKQTHLFGLFFPSSLSHPLILCFSFQDFHISPQPLMCFLSLCSVLFHFG